LCCFRWVYWSPCGWFLVTFFLFNCWCSYYCCCNCLHGVAYKLHILTKHAGRKNRFIDLSVSLIGFRLFRFLKNRSRFSYRFFSKPRFLYGFRLSDPTLFWSWACENIFVIVFLWKIYQCYTAVNIKILTVGCN